RTLTGAALGEVAAFLAALALRAEGFACLLPAAAGLLLMVLHRRPHWLGGGGRRFAAARGHLHLGVALAAVAALAGDNVMRDLAVSLSAAAALYLADRLLSGERLPAHLALAALPIALALTAEALSLHAWGGTVVALALVVQAGLS